MAATISAPLPSKSALSTILGAAFLGSVIAIVALYLCLQQERAEIDAGEVRAAQLARTSGNHLELTLYAIDRALKRASAEIGETGPSGAGAALARVSSFPERHTIELAFIDADGLLTETQLGKRPVPVNVAGRSYFLVHRDTPQVVTRMFPPVLSRHSGTWSIPVSRGVRNAEGTLIGVVSAYINATALGEVLHNVSMSPRDVLDIAGEDGTVWVRWPRATVGEELPSEPIDPERFVTSQAAVAGWPLAVRASLDRELLTAEVRPMQFFIAGTAAMQIILLAVFCAFTVRKNDELTRGRDVATAAARSARKRREQLAQIFDAKGAFVLLLDPDQRIILANKSVAEIVGLSQEELIGRTYASLDFGTIPAGPYEEWNQQIRLMAAEPAEYDADIRPVDGKRHIVRFTATPAFKDGCRLSRIVLIGVDDTARRDSEVKMFDTARLANLGEMASGVAHEVNQPLAIIRLAAESASEELEFAGTDTPTETLEFVSGKLKRITEQSERAAGIIRDLRTVARKAANDTEVFDLAQSVQVACNLLQEQMRLNRVDMRLHLSTEGAPVRGESNRLQQVAINLLNNARDAILEKSSPDTRSYAGHIDVWVTANGEQAVFTVEDDGPGVPAHALRRVFEPFFTTKPTGKGTGLGLSISYDIVKRMGGEFSVENRPEGGARFRVTFPLAQNQDAPVQSAAAS